MSVRSVKSESCKIDAEVLSSLRTSLPDIAEEIISNCNDRECYTHVDYEPIPSKESVIEIIDRLREILFPGYFPGKTRSHEPALQHGTSRGGPLRSAFGADLS